MPPSPHKTLLQKAKDKKVKPSFLSLPLSEQYALAEALLKGGVTLAQTSEALGSKYAGSAQSWLAAILKSGYRSGDIQIIFTPPNDPHKRKHRQAD